VHAEAVMTDQKIYVEAVEFNRRVQCAVWGLAVTMALTAWTIAPWVVHEDRSLPLWAVPGLSGLDYMGMALPVVMSVTLILGVAASAAASRPVAYSAATVGAVTFVLSAAFTDESAEAISLRYGVGGTRLMSCVFVVVFICIGRSARERRGKGRSAAWMDASFGTIDKRYFWRR
jgi:hypothetical protein